MKTVVTIVGARPQFIKAAAVSRALATRPNLRELLVHTGQHYDPNLSDVFFEELQIPRPAHHLGVGSGPHGAQTAQMLEAIERVLLAENPAAVLVYGDTNSTLAGALAASKLHLPVAHVEAGLRSFNRQMPEEINRVVTDHVSTWLFCPTHSSVQHLTHEGISRGVHHIGDVMYDVALEVAQRAEASSGFRTAGLVHKGFALATVHRAENTDDLGRLEAIFGALALVAARLPVVVPLHPRTRKIIEQRRVVLSPALQVVEPVGMVDMAWLERHAALVLTDSGGVQKEAYFHGTPCITMRTETEWTELVSAGWNRLADPRSSGTIYAAASSALDEPLPTTKIEEYGTGTAATRLADVLARAL